jgi:hypothetical protein
MEKTTSTVTRSWGATIGYLIGGVIMLAISALLFVFLVEGPVTLGIALIPAIVALILIYMSFGGAGTAVCPACRSPLSGLGTKRNDGVLCPHCGRYCEGTNGLLLLTDLNRVAEDPLFASPLPSQFAFPNGCCICGGPETKREKVSLRTQDASSAITAPTVGVTTTTTVSVEVPHCAEHNGGAMLTGTPKSTHIKFRSYPYLRAFCQVNGTTPG